MNVLQSNAAEVSRLEERLKSEHFTRPAFHHSTYATYFNLVDLHDRYYYSARSTHFHKIWQKKFLMGMLDSASINVWALLGTVNFCSFKTFRTDIGHDLVDIQTNEIPLN